MSRFQGGRAFFAALLLIAVAQDVSWAQEPSFAQTADPAARRPPPIQQGVQTELADEVSAYLVSEKLDGVRGYWDGQHLLSRSGREIKTPDWFVAGFPDYPLDGELWIARGLFEQVSALARRSEPDDHEWRAVKLMVFDLPAHPQVFAERYRIARGELDGVSPYLQVIEQKSLANAAALDALFDSVVQGGGEGLMLHRKDAHYRVGRSAHVVKLKPFYDAEAKVLAHLPGRGQLSGLLGSVLVRNVAGQEFKIGSGFSLAERRAPPVVGSTITYRYSGYTKNGVPRFARFLRVRDAE